MVRNVRQVSPRGTRPVTAYTLLGTAYGRAKDAPARPDSIKAPPPPAEVPRFAYVQGAVRDSVHDEPLAGAVVHIEGSSRIGLTDSLGRFLVDSQVPLASFGLVAPMTSRYLAMALLPSRT